MGSHRVLGLQGKVLIVEVASVRRGQGCPMKDTAESLSHTGGTSRKT